jgi:diguanylate cyclase (GGDEF)-like protein
VTGKTQLSVVKEGTQGVFSSLRRTPKVHAVSSGSPSELAHIPAVRPGVLAQLQLSFDAVAHPMLVLDTAGTVLIANAAMRPLCESPVPGALDNAVRWAGMAVHLSDAGLLRDLFGPHSRPSARTVAQQLDACRAAPSDLVDAALQADPDDVPFGNGRKHVVIRVRVDGRWHPVEASTTPLPTELGLSGTVVSLNDRFREEQLAGSLRRLAALRQEHHHLNERLQDREAFLTHLLRLQSSLSRRAPLPVVLQHVADGARELLGVDIAALLLLEPSGESSGAGKDGSGKDGPTSRTLLIAAHSGVSPQHKSPIRLQSADEGITRECLRSSQPVVIADYESLQHPVNGLQKLGVKAAMALPVRYGENVIGVLNLGSMQAGRRFTDLEVEMMATFAEHASIALRDARTVEEVREALNDPLTGLPNRQLLLDRLTQSLERCRRRSETVAVLFIDLDRFKAINDVRGHTIGDKVLRQVADRLSETVRGHDTAARLGGDEFVVVLEGTSPDEVRVVAERLRTAISQELFVDDVSYVVDASIGVAMDLDGRATPEQLVQEADIAMFRAKSGRHGPKSDPVFFEESMHHEVMARAETERELRFAIKSGGIQVAYQPVGDLRSGFVYGVEALARWDSPTQGSISPSVFVSLAEQTGNVVQLDRAVLRAALEGAFDLKDPVSGRPLMLNVNLSSQHLDNDEIVEDVASALRQTGYPATRLTLEITETEVMRDHLRSMERLQQLRRMGVHLALDDFGTGYSSLEYLREFPVQTLKIDRAFVTGIANAAQGWEDVTKPRRLMQAMIGLGHALGMQVLAEGVETIEQAATLRSMGLDLCQGYWLSRAVVPAELEAAMAHTAERLFQIRSTVPSGRTLTRVAGWQT